MARHLDNTAGTPAGSNATWTDSADVLATVAAAIAAGDTLYMASVHNETGSATVTFTNGTKAQPIEVICGTKDTTGDDAGVSDLADTGRVGMTGSMSFDGYVRWRGGEINPTGSTTCVVRFALAEAIQCYDGLKLLFDNTNAASDIKIGDSGTGENSEVTFTNLQLRFGNAGQQFGVNGTMRILGGSYISGGAGITPTVIAEIGRESRGGLCEIRDFNFSSLGNTFGLFTSYAGAVVGRAIRCKMPTGWFASGAVKVGTILNGSSLEAIDCSDGDETFRYWGEFTGGTIKSETSIKRTSGGAADENGQSIVYLMDPAADCSSVNILQSLPLFKPVDAGVQITPVVHIVHDGATAVTDKEVYVRIEAYSEAGSPLGVIYSDRSSPIVAAAAQTSSGEAWDNDSGTGPNGSTTWHQLKLDVGAITPQQDGYIVAWVCVEGAKAIYVDGQIS